MDFRFLPFEPPPELKSYLRRSFFAQGRIGYRSDKILPNGLAVVIFNLGVPHHVGKSEDPLENPSFDHSWLQGMQTTPTFNTPGGETYVVGLLFEPIGFHALFGIDMRALTDQTMDARDILPGHFISTVEGLAADAETEQAHAAIHAALSTLPKRGIKPWLSTFYDHIRDRQGQITLLEAYRMADRSPRHVNATFKTAIGVNPKTLCRIYRLQALLEAIAPAAPVNWSDLAAGFGFYDQAHFNREFRRLSGLHPTQYLAQRRQDLPELGKGESVHFAPQR